MSSATAVDSPIGRVTDFSEKKDNFIIVDFNEADFKSFISAGSMTVTYRAVDIAGNEAYATITVHIIDASKPAANTHVEKCEIRFISNRYYLDGAGGFVESSSGGLSAHSRWVTDNSYVDALTNVLGNSRRDGEWSVAPRYSFTFNRDAIRSIKSFVESNGIGASLVSFFDTFLKK